MNRENSRSVPTGRELVPSATLWGFSPLAPRHLAPLTSYSPAHTSDEFLFEIHPLGQDRVHMVCVCLSCPSISQAAKKRCRHARNSMIRTWVQQKNTSIGCSKRPFSAAAVSDEARRTLVIR
jgi:hypothetical protein